ncbi:hypothetical protein HBA55_21080 [Pseudomaricurvus alkylphenolicus]|uniref:hypothetical protein n=1 Tax=Pseudomaricurvus alkylphenolicus TaxID=1306991 RepID=UPI001421BDC6|nr:hypothetical protein [Pseudomaricurvus alkylphenolicus]NIB42113.1 hypothetical protein [Pseudomaricurvus alkylphenolicus]
MTTAVTGNTIFNIDGVSVRAAQAIAYACQLESNRRALAETIGVQLKHVDSHDVRNWDNLMELTPTEKDVLLFQKDTQLDLMATLVQGLMDRMTAEQVDKQACREYVDQLLTGDFETSLTEAEDILKYV